MPLVHSIGCLGHTLFHETGSIPELPKCLQDIPLPDPQVCPSRKKPRNEALCEDEGEHYFSECLYNLLHFPLIFQKPEDRSFIEPA
jgi:hypothetical protein